jgi:hypothetical protein
MTHAEAEKDLLDAVRWGLRSKEHVASHHSKAIASIALSGEYPETTLVVEGSRTYDGSSFRVDWPIWSGGATAAGELNVEFAANLVVDDVSEA